MLVLMKLQIMGSSPRMRGAHAFNVLRSSVDSIIPADAGSTHVDRIVDCSIKDHPRGCGEHGSDA